MTGNTAYGLAASMQQFSHRWQELIEMFEAETGANSVEIHPGGHSVVVELQYWNEERRP